MTTRLSLLDWVVYAEQLGAGEICLNSMDADGVRGGFDIEMLNAVCGRVNIPVIASGGCGGAGDFVSVFRQTEATGALAASIFHFGEATISDVKAGLRENGVHVR